jgi:hypothetical protein
VIHESRLDTLAGGQAISDLIYRYSRSVDHICEQHYVDRWSRRNGHWGVLEPNS